MEYQLRLRITLAVIAVCLGVTQAFNEFNSVNSAFQYEADKTTSLLDANSWYESLKEAYEVVTRNEEYLRKLKIRQEKFGGLYSGEGSAADQKRKVQEIEEQQHLQNLLDSNQIPNDSQTSKKLHQLYQSNFQSNKIRNNQNDLITHHKIPAMHLASNVKGGKRILSEADIQEYSVQELKEPYPLNGKCYNSGKLVDQTQQYYQCKQKDEYSDWIRVNHETYSILNSNYTSLYDCKNEVKHTQACECPQGYYDYQCKIPLYRKCFINITDPPFYKGCSDSKKDSEYYMYSLKGFEPCYFMNFSLNYTIKFNLKCMILDQSGLIEIDRENIGYKYRDVIEVVKKEEFSYVAKNPETKYSILKPEKFKVSLQFNDMKWLSNFLQFSAEYEDPEILAGMKEGSIQVDFSKLEASDLKGDSWFVVGGRAYFEIDILGDKISSFTTKGLFDKLGYQEPINEELQDDSMIYVIAVVFVLFLLLLIVFKTCKKAKLDKEHYD